MLFDLILLNIHNKHQINDFCFHLKVKSNANGKKTRKKLQPKKTGYETIILTMI